MNECDSHKTSLLYLFSLKRPLIEIRKALRRKHWGWKSFPSSFLQPAECVCGPWSTSKNGWKQIWFQLEKCLKCETLKTFQSFKVWSCPQHVSDQNRLVQQQQQSTENRWFECLHSAPLRAFVDHSTSWQLSLSSNFFWWNPACAD